MRHQAILRLAVVVIGVALGGAASVAEELSVAALLREGQHQQETLGDLSAASRLYRQVLERAEATSEQKTEAHLRLGQCMDTLGRSDEARGHFEWVTDHAGNSEAAAKAAVWLAGASSADPARVMPADTVAYVELIRPGVQLERILGQFKAAGLDDPLQGLMKQMQQAATGPGGGGGRSMAMAPVAMMLNASLVNELKKVEGLAIGVIPQDDAGTPKPENPLLMFVGYPGQSDAIRGMVELVIGAAAQSVEEHGGAKIYRLKGDQGAYAGVTARAIIVATKTSSEQVSEFHVAAARKLVADAIDRLGDTAASQAAAGQRVAEREAPAGSLAAQERFRRQAGARRQDSAVLAYMDLDGVLGMARKGWSDEQRQDFESKNKLLQLDAIDQVSARAQLTDDGVAFELALSLKPGMTSALYDLLRTPPADRDLLKAVPANAIGLATLKLERGAEFYDRAIDLVTALALLDRKEKETEEDSLPAARIAAVAKLLGVSFRDEIFAGIEGIVVAVTAPSPADLRVRPAGQAGSADAPRPAEAGVPSKADARRVMLARSMAVLKVRDPQAFDALIMRLLNVLAAKAAEGQQVPEVAVKQSEVEGGELREYVVPGVPVVPAIYRKDRIYVITASKELAAEAAKVAAGLQPSVFTEALSSQTLAEVPQEASKILALRVDHLVNLLRGFALASREAMKGRSYVSLPDLWLGGIIPPEFPAVKPIVVYTLEGAVGPSLRVEVRDMPKLIQAGAELARTMQQYDMARSAARPLADAPELSALGKHSAAGVGEAVSRARSTKSDSLSAHGLLVCGEFRLLGGDREEAVKLIEQAAAQGSAQHWFHKSLGWARLAAGRQAEAKEAFQKAIAGTGDWSTRAPDSADPDHWTAAYFMDLVTAEAFADRWSKPLSDQRNLACFPWFYIGQRMEIEGKRDRAVEAYRKSVELGNLPNAHHVRHWAAYRLQELEKPASTRPG